MNAPFPIVISPYDLDARGLVADTAFLLGDPAITLLPAPLEGHDAPLVSAAAAAAPEFARLIQRWSWMQDLWRAGAIRPAFAGIDPLDLIQEAASEILTRYTALPLASVMRSDIFESTHTYLRALCRDLATGGSQPSVSIPVTVGLSRYAHALDAPLIQQHHARRSGSVVQKLESSALRTSASLTILIPRDVETEVTLAIRAAMQDQLSCIREAIATPTARQTETDLHILESAFNTALLDAASNHGLTTAPKRGRRLSLTLLSIATTPADTALEASILASTMATARRHRPDSAHQHQNAALALRPQRILSVRELPWQHPNA